MVIRRLLAAAILAFGLAPPAVAAGWFEGPWLGEAIAVGDRRDACGFSKTQVGAHVDDQRLVVTARDTRTERRFEGAFDETHKISLWAPWESAEGSGQANLVGAFSSSGFQGSLYAGEGAACEARVFLWRPPGSREAHDRDLVQAAIDGLAGAASLAIEQGADPNVEDHQGRTPLIAAAAGGHAEVVRILLAAGADRERPNASGDTALAAAKAGGKIEVAALLGDSAAGARARRVAAAERQAQAARRLAEAEETRRAEAARRLAEAEERRRTEAARRLAEADETRQAEDARRLAEAEETRRAEEAERRRKEAEARRLAEAEEKGRSEAAEQLRRQEAAQWSRVRNSRDAAELQRFAEAYPKGDFATLARARAEQLESVAAQRAELDRWSKIKNSRKVEDFVAYVRTYPNGLFTDFAEARIRSLGALAAERSERVLWDSIKDSPRATDVERYLARHPEGRFADEARIRVERLAQAAVLRGIDFGRYHALVIGSNTYRHPPALQTAVTDAESVARTLRRRYGFEVTLLTNATREAMIDAFDGYRRRLDAGDNLLVYYAGHGYFDEEAQRGYWLPVNARADSTAQWLSNATITDQLKAIAAKHVLVVADSCYSGALTRAAKIGIQTRTYLSRMANKRARTVLTSGGLEPVADGGGGRHSVFAKAFLETLEANTEVLDGTQLFQKLRRPVMVNAPQTPQYSDIRYAGHDGGDFLFVPRD